MNRRSFMAEASALVTVSSLPKAWASPSRWLCYLGSLNTDVTPQAKAQAMIYSCFFDARTGEFSPVSPAAEVVQPSGFALAPNKRYLYSTSEVRDNAHPDGGLYAFAINHRSGGLKLLNRVSSGGRGPTSMKLDATGKTAAVALYVEGRTNAFQVLPDGRLGEQTASMAHSGSGPNRRQNAPHPHCVVFSPDNRFVLVADLGADRIFIFRFDAATGTLSPHDPAFVQVSAGSGPRQLAFHPNGRFVYLLCELIAQVTVYAWSAKEGNLSEVQTISLGSGNNPANLSAAGLLMRSDGRFLYTTTRIDSTVEMFTIDSTKGTLVAGPRVHPGGTMPWGSAIDPTGRHLLVTNLDSNSVSLFRIDPATGDLSLLRSSPTVPAPGTAIIVPA